MFMYGLMDSFVHSILEKTVIYLFSEWGHEWVWLWSLNPNQLSVLTDVVCMVIILTLYGKGFQTGVQGPLGSYMDIPD